MCTFLNGKMIKRIRKRHVCFCCGRIIPKGTMSNYSVSVENGELSASHSCLDCEEFSLTKEALDLAEDGCFPQWCFSEESYARFPILEPA